MTANNKKGRKSIIHCFHNDSHDSLLGKIIVERQIPAIIFEAVQQQPEQTIQKTQQRTLNEVLQTFHELSSTKKYSHGIVQI